jgi:HK97 family phage major capsid protein
MTKEELQEVIAAEVKSGVDAALAKTVDKSIGQSLLGSGPTVIKSPEVVKTEITAARFIKSLAACNNDRQAAFKLAQHLHPQDKMLMESFETKALSANILSDGGATIPQILASEIIMPLYNKIGVTKLGGRKIPMPNGNMTIPRINTATTVGWIGENAPAGVSQPVTGDAKLNAKKLAVFTAVSNDLLRSADIAADQWILDDIRNQMFVEMDRAMLYGLNTAFTPGGLSTLLPSSQILGDSTTAFPTTLISTLYGQLGQDNVQLISPGIIINAVTEAYLITMLPIPPVALAMSISSSATGRSSSWVRRVI